MPNSHLVLVLMITSLYNAFMAKKQRFSDQLRRAVMECGKTRYKISLETDIPQSNLSRFVHGNAGLSMESIDLLCECIDARLEMDRKAPKKKR